MKMLFKSLTKFILELTSLTFFPNYRFQVVEVIQHWNKIIWRTAESLLFIDSLRLILGLVLAGWVGDSLPLFAHNVQLLGLSQNVTLRGHLSVVVVVVIVVACGWRDCASDFSFVSHFFCKLWTIYKSN